MRDEFSKAEIDKNDLRRVLAIGIPHAPVVIPVEIASQLDEMTKKKNVLGRTDAKLMAMWKAYLLLSPDRIAAYNLRNLTGDSDGMIAGAIPIHKNIASTMPELWNYYQGEIALSERLRGARNLAVINSSMAAVELSDLQNIKVLERFLIKPRPLHQLPVDAVKKYFEVAHRYTEFRENILRYSAYVTYQNLLKQEIKEPGTLKHFGNSRRDNILELLKELGVDVTAAKMARDLLGDYGNISIFGQWMRSHVYPFWCVPDDTEILTRDGWKRHNEISIGEKCLTYNLSDRKTEWQPIRAIARFQMHGTLRTISKNPNTKFRFTEDHRWVVHEKYGKKQKLLSWPNMKTHHHILRIAPHKFQTRSVLSAHDAALLGWLVTDGYHRTRKEKYFEAMIYQSPKKHAQEIRDRFAKDISGVSEHPKTGVLCFRLKLKSLIQIRRVYKKKSDLPRIVTRLGKKAAIAMWDAMYKAEGSIAKGSQSFSNTDGSVIDAFQILSAMLGRVYNFSLRKPMRNCFGHKPCFNGYIQRTQLLQQNKWKKGQERYKGVVWCPVTENQTWIMRQNGKITITGNSWQEINMQRVPRLAINAIQAGDLRATTAVPVIALRLILISRLAWMYSAFWTWNNMFNGHKERELTFYDRSNPHIVVCRTPDGSVRTFRNVGMMGDAMEWFGLNTFFSSIPELEGNSLTWPELIQEMAKDPANKVFGGLRPDFKALLEGTTGLTFFPDAFNPRSVDRLEIAASNLDLRDVYLAARGALEKNGMRAKPHALARIMVGISDKRKNALSEMYALRDRFLSRRGREKGIFPRSEFSVVRQALMNDDFEAYKEAMVVWARRKQQQGQKFGSSYFNSVRRLDPIDSALNKTLETEFEQNFLNSSQRDRLRVARDYAQDLSILAKKWFKRFKSELKQTLKQSS